MKLLKNKTCESDWNLPQFFSTRSITCVAWLPQAILAAAFSVTHMQGKQEKLFPILLPNDIEINCTVESISDMTGL